MSATQGVLLRYHGGEVYALPTADRHVWRVAGVEVHVDLVATHPVHNEVIGVEAFDTLAGAVEITARVAAERARLAAEAATKAKRTGKGRAKR